MAGEADHPGVEAEVLAAELGPDAGLPGQVEDHLLHLQVAEGPAVLVAGGGEPVEVAAGGQLDRLEGGLGRGAADDHGEVVGRAGGGAQRAQLLLEEAAHRRRVQQGLGLLEEQGLVGRPAALGDEQELVLGAGDGVDLDLGGEVGAGVALLEHGERRQLRVAQVAAGVGVEDAVRQRLLVAPAGVHVLALVGEHDGGAGVLAGGEDHLGRDHGVAQHLPGDEAVVVRGLGVVEDGPQLLQVPGAEEVGDVAHRLGGETAQHRGIDPQDASARPPPRPSGPRPPGPGRRSCRLRVRRSPGSGRRAWAPLARQDGSRRDSTAVAAAGPPGRAAGRPVSIAAVRRHGEEGRLPDHDDPVVPAAPPGAEPPRGAGAGGRGRGHLLRRHLPEARRAHPCPHPVRPAPSDGGGAAAPRGGPRLAAAAPAAGAGLGGSGRPALRGPLQRLDLVAGPHQRGRLGDPGDGHPAAAGRRRRWSPGGTGPRGASGSRWRWGPPGWSSWAAPTSRCPGGPWPATAWPCWAPPPWPGYLLLARHLGPGLEVWSFMGVACAVGGAAVMGVAAALRGGAAAGERDRPLLHLPQRPASRSWWATGC